MRLLKIPCEATGVEMLHQRYQNFGPFRITETTSPSHELEGIVGCCPIPQLRRPKQRLATVTSEVDASPLI